MAIHPTAIVDPTAEIGSRVRIDPYAVIGGVVEIGDDCHIGPHVVIHSGARIGEGCTIHAGAVIADLPQDLAFRDEESYVNIGARCTIREGVTIHRGTKSGTSTVVGDGCFLMAFSHVAHNVVLGEQVILANGVLLGGYVEVGDKAFLSGNAVVHQFVKIGSLAMLSGNCGLSKDFPPFCASSAVTRNRVSGLNSVGLRRAGYTAEERQAIRKAFHIVYQSGLNVSQAVERMREEFPADGAAASFREFIATSKRGIARADVMDGP